MPRRDRQRPVLPAGRHRPVSGKTTFRNDLLRTTVVVEPTPRSSARTRSRSTSAGARPSCPTGRSASRARIDATELALGMNFGEHRPRRPSPSRSSPLDDDPAARAATHPAAGLRPAGVRRPARGRAVRPGGRRPGGACPTSTGGSRYAVADPARYVDPATGTRPRPVRQRDRRTGRLQLRRRDHRGRAMSAIVRTDGLVKRYDGTLAVAGVDLAVERGRDLRPGRPERRRQDDDPAHPRDAPRAVGGRRRDRRHRRSPGTRTRSAASSASCPTPSASTTT